jgi:amidase
MAKALSEVDLLVLPTVPFYPPLLADARGVHYTTFTNPVNLAGFPAVALPVPSSQRLPASLQLIGPPGSEALLLATAAIVEAAAGISR